jgi:hypothetical protein
VLGLATALLGLQLTGCTPTICSRTSDCNTGLVCTANGRCELPPDAPLVDASTGDGTTPSADGATLDATPSDATTFDSTTLDAPLIDAATLDDGGL